MTCLILFVCLNSYYILIKKNSKINDIYSFLYLWVLYFGNIKNPDYNNYLMRFLHPEVIEKNIGEKFIYISMLTFNRISNNYNLYLLIISFICLTFLFYTIFSFSKNRALVYLLYFLYPYFLDVIQLKNFILECILIFSIAILLKKNSVFKSFFIYIFSIGAHIASILYLPIFTFFKIENKKIERIVMYSISIFFLLYLIVYFKLFNLKYLLFFLPEDRRINYSSRTANLGWILTWVFQLVSFYLVKYCIKNDKYFRNTKEYNKLYKVYIYSLFFLGFYFFNTTYERMYRNLSVFTYILFSNMYFNLKGIKKYIFLFTVLIFILVLYMYFINYRNLDKTILENNFVI